MMTAVYVSLTKYSTFTLGKEKRKVNVATSLRTLLQHVRQRQAHDY